MLINSNRPNYQTRRKPPEPQTFGSITCIKTNNPWDSARRLNALIKATSDNNKCRNNNHVLLTHPNSIWSALFGFMARNKKPVFVLVQPKENTLHIVAGESVQKLYSVFDKALEALLKKEHDIKMELCRKEMDDDMGVHVKDFLDKNTDRTLSIAPEKPLEEQVKIKETSDLDIVITPKLNDVSSSTAPKAKTPPKGKLVSVK